MQLRCALDLANERTLQSARPDLLYCAVFPACKRRLALYSRLFYCDSDIEMMALVGVKFRVSCVITQSTGLRAGVSDGVGPQAWSVSHMCGVSSRLSRGALSLGVTRLMDPMIEETENRVNPRGS